MEYVVELCADFAQYYRWRTVEEFIGSESFECHSIIVLYVYDLMFVRMMSKQVSETTAWTVYLPYIKRIMIILYGYVRTLRIYLDAQTIAKWDTWATSSPNKNAHKAMPYLLVDY